MLTTVALATWVLLATVRTLTCTGTDCQLTRGSQAVAGPHRLTAFPTRDVCEAYRKLMQERQLPAKRSVTHPDRVIKKEITYTCKEGGEAL